MGFDKQPSGLPGAERWRCPDHLARSLSSLLLEFIGPSKLRDLLRCGRVAPLAKPRTKNRKRRNGMPQAVESKLLHRYIGTMLNGSTTEACGMRRRAPRRERTKSDGVTVCSFPASPGRLVSLVSAFPASGAPLETWPTGLGQARRAGSCRDWTNSPPLVPTID